MRVPNLTIYDGKREVILDLNSSDRCKCIDFNYSDNGNCVEVTYDGLYGRRHLIFPIRNISKIEWTDN